MMWGTPGCAAFSGAILRALLKGSVSQCPGADEAAAGAIGWWWEERARNPKPGQNPTFPLPTLKKGKNHLPRPPPSSIGTKGEAGMRLGQALGDPHTSGFSKRRTPWPRAILLGGCGRAGPRARRPES